MDWTKGGTACCVAVIEKMEWRTADPSRGGGCYPALTCTAGVICSSCGVRRVSGVDVLSIPAWFLFLFRPRSRSGQDAGKCWQNQMLQNQKSGSASLG